MRHKIFDNDIKHRLTYNHNIDDTPKNEKLRIFKLGASTDVHLTKNDKNILEEMYAYGHYNSHERAKLKKMAKEADAGEVDALGEIKALLSKYKNSEKENLEPIIADNDRRTDKIVANLLAEKLIADKIDAKRRAAEQLEERLAAKRRAADKLARNRLEAKIAADRQAEKLRSKRILDSDRHMIAKRMASREKALNRAVARNNEKSHKLENSYKRKIHDLNELENRERRKIEKLNEFAKMAEKKLNEDAVRVAVAAKRRNAYLDSDILEKEQNLELKKAELLERQKDNLKKELTIGDQEKHIQMDILNIAEDNKRRELELAFEAEKVKKERLNLEAREALDNLKVKNVLGDPDAHAKLHEIHDAEVLSENIKRDPRVQKELRNKDIIVDAVELMELAKEYLDIDRKNLKYYLEHADPNMYPRAGEALNILNIGEKLASNVLAGTPGSAELFRHFMYHDANVDGLGGVYGSTITPKDDIDDIIRNGGSSYRFRRTRRARKAGAPITDEIDLIARDRLINKLKKSIERSEEKVLALKKIPELEYMIKSDEIHKDFINFKNDKIRANYNKMIKANKRNTGKRAGPKTMRTYIADRQLRNKVRVANKIRAARYNRNRKLGRRDNANRKFNRHLRPWIKRDSDLIRNNKDAMSMEELLANKKLRDDVIRVGKSAYDNVIRLTANVPDANIAKENAENLMREKQARELKDRKKFVSRELNHIKNPAEKERVAEHIAMVHTDDNITGNTPEEIRAKISEMNEYHHKADAPIEQEILTVFDREQSEIQLKNATLDLPIVSILPIKNEKASAKIVQLDQKLRNTITKNKIPSGLITVELSEFNKNDKDAPSNKSYLNVAESAQKIKIVKGKVIIPTGGRDRMQREGKDVSHLTEIFDDESKRKHYEFDASGMSIDMPTHNNDYSTNLLKNENEFFDMQDASKLLIKEGTLEMIPWKDFEVENRENESQGDKFSKLEANNSSLQKDAQDNYFKGINNFENEQSNVFVFKGANGEDVIQKTDSLGNVELVNGNKITLENENKLSETNDLHLDNQHKVSERQTLAEMAKHVVQTSKNLPASKNILNKKNKLTGNQNNDFGINNSNESQFHKEGNSAEIKLYNKLIDNSSSISKELNMSESTFKQIMNNVNLESLRNLISFNKNKSNLYSEKSINLENLSSKEGLRPLLEKTNITQINNTFSKYMDNGTGKKSTFLYLKTAKPRQASELIINRHAPGANKLQTQHNVTLIGTRNIAHPILLSGIQMQQNNQPQYRPKPWNLQKPKPLFGTLINQPPININMPPQNTPMQSLFRPKRPFNIRPLGVVAPGG